MKKKYRLVLYPDTFLWIKNGGGLIYNSKNHRSFEFDCVSHIRKLCNALIDLKNLYSTELTEELLLNEQVKNWTNNIVDIEAGKLVEQNGENKKIVSYYPFVTIQNNIKKILWKNGLNIGGDIIKNLDEIVFYFNGSLQGNRQHYKQTYYPLKTNDYLSFEHIKTFIDRCRGSILKKITFIGNLFKYKDFNKLQQWILSKEHSVHLVLLLEDIICNYANLERLAKEEVELTIIVNLDSLLPHEFDVFKRIHQKINWKFPITSCFVRDAIALKIHT